MVSLRTLLYENTNIEDITEINPVTSVIQGLHTRKILKGMSPEERKELGKFLRDKEFLKLSQQFHTDPDEIGAAEIMTFIKNRIDDPELRKKITTVTLDPKFDQARNRLATKLLVPRDTLPKSDEPLAITPTAQKRIDRQAKKAEKSRKEFHKLHGTYIKLQTLLRTAKFINPVTKKKILVRSGLRAPADSEVHKAAYAEYQKLRAQVGLEVEKSLSPTNVYLHTGLDLRKRAEKQQKLQQRQKDKRASISQPTSFRIPGSRSGGSGGFGGFGGGGGFSGGGGGISF